MSMMEWAKKEVEIACERERGKSQDKGEWDYGCACYESALKAFNSLCEDNHSGFSIGITKNILNRLIDGKPLTPIYDSEDIWNDVTCTADVEVGFKNYQCKRMGSLFKKVYSDGVVIYSDTNRCCCVDIDNPNSTYTFGLVNKIIDEMFPITMPYIPVSTPIKVYCQDLLTDRKNGDFDTVGISHAIFPDGRRVDIDRQFKESGDGFVEITIDEYLKRKELDEFRKMEERRESELNEHMPRERRR